MRSGDIFQRLLAHDRGALAHVLTLLENEAESHEEGLRTLYARAGHAVRVGITGQPGAGKSTLVAALAKELRRTGQTVGILALDPSSPFTKGALLGDRIRMLDLFQDEGVFVRSMAGRGQQLAASAFDAVAALDAFGMDVVIVETIGAGQDEVDVRQIAPTVVVVEIPGAGDAVQSLKAGILEIADIFVVNKADLPGADAVASQLKQLISFKAPAQWQIPVLKTVATVDGGIADLAAAISSHLRFLEDSGALACRRKDGARYQLRRLAFRKLEALLDEAWEDGGLLDRTATALAAGLTDPYTGAARLLEAVGWPKVSQTPARPRKRAQPSRRQG